MYKDLSLKEKAKIIREGVRLGLTSIDDIQNLYDEAIYNQKENPIVTPYGQWKYPGRDTIILSNNITMDNVNYPVLGVSDTGDAKVMLPWHNYHYTGSIVYEHPLIGNQYQLGGLAKPFSYGDIPDVRYQRGEEIQKYKNVPDYNIALYNSVSPLGDFPNFWGAVAYRRNAKEKVKKGNIYERDYKVGDTQGEKTAMAAWAKRLRIPYDEQDLPVYNGDTVTLPYSLVQEIPYDTNMLIDRINKNKALQDKYSKYRYSKVVNAAIKADQYNLDKLRETYKTGKPVGQTEFGWNSRQLVNNGEIVPIENIQSPLNVLGNYNVRYSPEERRLYYSDEYDFNQFENFVPGEPYRIRGYIDLDNNKALGGNLFKTEGGHLKQGNTQSSSYISNGYNPEYEGAQIYADNRNWWERNIASPINTYFNNMSQRAPEFVSALQMFTPIGLVTDLANGNTESVMSNIGAFNIGKDPESIKYLLKKYNEDKFVNYLERKTGKIIKRVPIKDSKIGDVYSEGFSYIDDEGKEIAHIAGNKSRGNNVFVESSYISPEFRNQGIGKQMYLDFNQNVYDNFGTTLHSSPYQHQATVEVEPGSGVFISPSSKLWRGLKQKGMAEIGGQGLDKYYIMNQPSEMKSITEFSKGGGIHINPKNKGKFNATKKRTSKTTEELTHSKNPLTRKRAIFAQNAKRWNHKHDEGGYLYSEGGFLLAPYLYIE